MLDRQEVLDLLRCVTPLQHRMALTTMYATGLRVSERDWGIRSRIVVPWSSDKRNDPHAEHGAFAAGETSAAR